ncbi:MAG: lactonase family protein [Bdellovibrionales bacterium]|nr:lactonase family protein [Bdellovibrionales bacterium]
MKFFGHPLFGFLFFLSLSAQADKFSLIGEIEHPDIKNIVPVMVDSGTKWVFAASYSTDKLTTFALEASTGALSYKSAYADPLMTDGSINLIWNKDRSLLALSSAVSHTVNVFYPRPDTGEIVSLGYMKEGEGGATGLVGAKRAEFSIDSKRIYVAGSEGVAVGRLEDGELQFIAGLNPGKTILRNMRGFSVHPSERWIYLVDGVTNSMVRVDFDLAAGKMTLGNVWTDQQMLNGDKLDNLTGAFGTLIDSSGKYLYLASGRFTGTNAITVFEILGDGSLKQVQRLMMAQGEYARLDGMHMMTMNSHEDEFFISAFRSNTVGRFQRSPLDGTLRLAEIIDTGTDSPAGVSLSADDQLLLVGNEFRGAISILRRSSGK